MIIVSSISWLVTYIITIDNVLDTITNIDFLSSNKVILSNGVIDKFNKLFKRDGFYSWATIKYLLYVYDISDTQTLSEQQLDPVEYFKQDPRDYFSIEHIYPQKAVNEYWVNRFNGYNEKQRKILSSSLGNLLPLSKTINSKLQNNSFIDKKERYSKGSRSEIKVANESEWTPELILQRGLTILNFMEKEWDFIIPNLAYKKRILGLDFMIKPEDEFTDVTEPIIIETQPSSTREVSYLEDDYISNLEINDSQDDLIKSQSERLRLEFWNRFNEILIDRGTPFNVRKASISHWYDVTIGSNNSHITIELINRGEYIRIGLYMVNDKDFFDKLFTNKEKIEDEIGLKLDWLRECPGSVRVSRIKYHLSGLNFSDQNNYDELINKTIDITIKMQKVFLNPKA